MASRTITFPPGAVPGLEELVAKWDEVASAGPLHKSYFNLPGERCAYPPGQIDTWLRLVLDHLGEQPPAGEAWSGHSLRKGAASGAAAIDVALFRICFMGGWSIKSAAVHDYIDATCPPSAAARRFFGWLTRH